MATAGSRRGKHGEDPHHGAQHLLPCWHPVSAPHPAGTPRPELLCFEGGDGRDGQTALGQLRGLQRGRGCLAKPTRAPLRSASVLRSISTSPEPVSFGERFSLESKNIPSLFTKIWQYTEFKKKIIIIINHSYNRFGFISFKGNSTNRSVKVIIHSCALKILVFKTSLSKNSCAKLY